MNSRTKSQKIIKVGNSYAVTLDKEFVNKTGLKNQQYVSVRYDETEPSMVISLKDASAATYTTSKKLSKKEKSQYLASEITPEFRKWVDDFMEENKEAMEALANL